MPYRNCHGQGTLEDMQQVRQALDSLGDNRPAVLRKDFLIDEYQVGGLSCLSCSRHIENASKLTRALRSTKRGCMVQTRACSLLPSCRITSWRT
jgi:hypothetical protein